MPKTYDIPPSTRRPIGTISVEAQTLAKLLAETPVGALISYEVLSTAIGRDITKDARWALDTARTKVMREERMVFGTMKGLGLKRLNDVETVQTGAAAISHIKRTAARSLEKVTCPDSAALPPDAQQQQFLYISINQLHIHISKRKSLRAIATAVKAKLAPLDLNETLRHFHERAATPRKQPPPVAGSKPELPPGTGRVQ